MTSPTVRTRQSPGVYGAVLHASPRDDPIAPTEFPTGWSAARRPEALRPGSSVTYSPQEEDTVSLSRPKTAIGLGLPPIVFRKG